MDRATPYINGVHPIPEATPARKRWAWLIEASVILAGAGSLYWSGRIAARLESVEVSVLSIAADVRRMNAIDENVRQLCLATPDSRCNLKDGPR